MKGDILGVGLAPDDGSLVILFGHNALRLDSGVCVDEDEHKGTGVFKIEAIDPKHTNIKTASAVSPPVRLYFKDVPAIDNAIKHLEKLKTTMQKIADGTAVDGIDYGKKGMEDGNAGTDSEPSN